MNNTKLTYLDEIIRDHPDWLPDMDNDYRTHDFVDTRRFSPVIYDDAERMPDKSNPEYATWWNEQYVRCVKGYVVRKATKRGHDVWIPGRYYFYLNFWIIFALLDDVNRKGNRNPRFLSLDYFKFMSIEVAFLESVDQAYGKARQKGFSEFIACILAYNYTFMEGSQSVVVAGMGDYAEHTFQNVRRGLDNLVQTEFYKRRSPNRGDYICSHYTEKVEEVDEDGEPTGIVTSMVQGFGSEIYCITAKNNTQAVSRLSPFMIVYEEMGKWAKDTLIETSRFVKPSLETAGNNGTVKTGWQIFIGTGGDMDESVADVQKIMYHPGDYNIKGYRNTFEETEQINTGQVGCFIPGYLFKIIDEDGNDLIPESIAAIKAEREDTTNENVWRDATQTPLYLSEMFMMSGGGYFGKDVIQRLNDRKRRILNNKDLQIMQVGDLIWKDSKDWRKGVYWKPNPDGKFNILQHPEANSMGHVYANLYNAATDSYDKDESNSSESQGSCTIWKTVLDADHTYNHWVARITERPTVEEGGSPAFYEDTVKLCIYYGDCENLIEYSNILIFDYYKRWGVEDLLKERPSLIISQNVKDPKASQRYGVEQSFVPYALRMLKERFRQDSYALIEKLYDMVMIERFAAFKIDPHYNCDITICSAFNITSDVEDRELEIYSEGEEKQDDDYGGYEIRNGKLRRA